MAISMNLDLDGKSAKDAEKQFRKALERVAKELATPLKPSPDLEAIISEKRKNTKKEPVKTYLLDTNVLMNDPFAHFVVSGNEVNESAIELLDNMMFSSLSSYHERKSPNNIIIPETVLREIDELKTRQEKKDLLPKIALFNKSLNGIMSEENLVYRDDKTSCWRLENGAKLFITDYNPITYEKKLNYDVEDNKIVYLAEDLQTKMNPFPLKFKRLLSNAEDKIRVISNDTGLQNRAIHKGINSEVYKSELIRDLNQLRKGRKDYFKNEQDLQKLKKDTITRTLGEFKSKYDLPPKEAFSVNDSICIYTENETEEDIDKIKENQIFEGEYRIVDKREDSLVVRTLDHLKEFEEKIMAQRGVVSGEESSSYSLKDIRRTLEESKEKSSKGKTKNTKRNKKIDNIRKELDSIKAKDTSAIEKISKRMYEELGLETKEKVNYGNIGFNKNINPKLEQKVLLDHLLNPEIDGVSALGKAGTGKTLFALLAGVYQLTNKKYTKIVYAKPLKGIGEDLGYLPGSFEEKVEPWVKSAVDNIYEIFNLHDKPNKQTNEYVNKLFEDDKINFEIAHTVQGRTYRNTYLILDEAHNYDRWELMMWLTRVGKGTKVVLLGDLYQIKSLNKKYKANLSEASSGMSHFIEKMEGDPTVAHINLSDAAIERSYFSQNVQKKMLNEEKPDANFYRRAD